MFKLELVFKNQNKTKTYVVFLFFIIFIIFRLNIYRKLKTIIHNNYY
jgi:hypothetical protein